MYYYGARWYDASLARFTQPDSIVPDPADPQQLGRFTYVRNSPLCYVDPSGHALEGSATGDDPYRNRNPSRYYGPKSKEAPAETDYMAFYEYQYGLRAVDPNPIVGIGGWLPGEELECAAYESAYHSYTFQAGYSSTQAFVDNLLPFLGEAFVAVGMTAVGMGSDLLGAAVSAARNPNGCRGGAAHQAGVRAVIDDIVARELEPRTEYRVNLVGGGTEGKQYRRVDVAALDAKLDPVEFHNVGDVTASGQPVAREWRAQTDVTQHSVYTHVPFYYHAK